MLSHAGNWLETPNGKLTFVVAGSPAPQARWTERAREHWSNLASLLSKLDMKWLFDGELTLMMPRTQCQAEAESHIRDLSHLVSLPPSSLFHQGHIWGMDGSMVPMTGSIGDDKSVTDAVTGPQTIVVRLNGRNLCILHGELIGLIMGLGLSDNETPNNKIFTDHLNSVHFIDDAEPPLNKTTI